MSKDLLDMFEKFEKKEEPIKPVVPEAIIPIDEDMIKISSDNFRTAFYLIVGTSNRKNIKVNKKTLEQFFQDYRIVKSGRDYYFKKK